MANASAPDAFLSAKFRFWSFVSMLLLVYVHGYNLVDSYLQPFTLPMERMTGTTFFEYWLSNGVARFRIPMLFAISGYLFALGDGKPFWPRFRKRLRTLGIPYLAWAAIGVGITAIFEYADNRTCDAVMEAGIAGNQMLGDMPIGETIWLGLFQTTFQLWFLRTLLICNLFYPLIKLGLEARRRWIFGTVLILLTLCWLVHLEDPIGTLLNLVGLHIYIPLSILAPESFLSFTLGVWLCKRGGIPVAPPFKTKAWHWVALWLTLATGKSLWALMIPNYQDHFAQVLCLMLVHKLTVATGLVAAWYAFDGLVRRCMANAAFVWASAFAFIIYTLHVPLVNYTTRLVFNATHQYPYHRIVTYLFLPMSIIAFCILVGWLLRTLVPSVYSVLTGGRGGVRKRVVGEGVVA